MRRLLDGPRTGTAVDVLPRDVTASQVEQPSQTVRRGPSTLIGVILEVQAQFDFTIAVLRGLRPARTIEAVDQGGPYIGREQKDGGESVAAEWSLRICGVNQEIGWVDAHSFDEPPEVEVTSNLIGPESPDGSVLAQAGAL